MTAETFNHQQSAALPYVRAWLLGVAALIFCMVIVGGATRLTDSGLSITEWQPLLGAIPPFTEAHWLEAFENNWRSDTMWRARLWIPYLAMPVGLVVLSLQMLADLAELLTGRQHPFGISPGTSVAEAIAVRETGT